VSALGNVKGLDLIAMGMVTAAGDVSGANLISYGIVSAAGEVQADSFSSVADVVVGGDVLVNGGDIKVLATGNIGVYNTAPDATTMMPNHVYARVSTSVYNVTLIQAKQLPPPAPLSDNSFLALL
jgi:hypothetical protein